MNDIEFKRHFRFTKEHVLKLTELKAEDLISDSNRGLPGDKTSQMFWWMKMSYELVPKL